MSAVEESGTTHVLLARHGETEWNRARRIQGQTDTPLSALGLAQANALADAIRDEPLDAVWSSDLVRAVATAEPLARRRDLPVTTDRGLRERHYGAFEGLALHELPQRFPTLVPSEAALPDVLALAPPDGETRPAFVERVRATFMRIVSAQRGLRIAIVAHGGVLDAVVRIARGLPAEGPREWAIPNACVCRLAVDADGRIAISRWGDVSHLGTLATEPPPA